MVRYFFAAHEEQSLSQHSLRRFVVTLVSADGFRIIYDREVPFELRVQESADGPQQVGTLEAIKVKVLILVRWVSAGGRTEDELVPVSETCRLPKTARDWLAFAYRLAILWSNVLHALQRT